MSERLSVADINMGSVHSKVFQMNAIHLSPENLDSHSLLNNSVLYGYQCSSRGLQFIRHPLQHDFHLD